MGYNKATGGKAKVGGLSIDGTDLTATATELNRQDVSVNQGAQYIKVIDIVADGTTAEQDTGYDIPTYSLVNDVNLIVTTAASAGSLVNVGLLSTSSGDADGFLAGVSSTGTGIKAGIPTASSSAGVASTTRGALLRVFFAGEDGMTGTHSEIRHLSDSKPAKSVTWTINGTSTTFVGQIVLNITELTT